jgi:acetyl-CoA carboxylase biotin carboxylase subunit
MKMALSELIIQGITHNRNLHLDILSDKEFVDGTYTTGFMEDFDKRRNKQKEE